MAIGDAFKRSREVRLAALALGMGVVLVDLSVLHTFTWIESSSARIPLTWFALLSLGYLARWDTASLGLRITPVQGWRYWFKALAILSAVALVLIAVACGLFNLLGQDIMDPPQRWRLHEVVNRLLAGCLEAPLQEEMIYRFSLCVGVVALVGMWPTIVLSGLVFACLHFVYGNAGPNNFVAGYILAWAFLHSESLAVPIILHALGNLCVLIFLLLW